MPEQERTYRRWIESDLQSFEAHLGESDLLVSAERSLPNLAERALRAARADLEAYLDRDPEFGRSLRPREALPGAPDIVLTMAEAARTCGVGPMAAVAGAVAEAVGEALLAESGQVIVENGGDIFLRTSRPRVAALYAGRSPLSGRIGVRINRVNESLGLCTSSGTVGHSLSLGQADAAVVLARHAPLADAAATTLGNRIASAADIEVGLEFLRAMEGVLGGAVVAGDRLGAWGDLELVRLDSPGAHEAAQ
jgi:ApbE superfamily uncharacterized protein (UPF0280 family)